MLHVGPVSQTCAIIDIDRAFIRTGDKALVAFRFVQRPEYLAPGDRLIFREGRTKGLGIVKSVGYDPKKPLNPDADKDEDGRKATEGVSEEIAPVVNVKPPVKSAVSAHGGKVAEKAVPVKLGQSLGVQEKALRTS